MNDMKYITYYDHEKNCSENRYYSPACKNKVDYISDVLKRIGKAVEIISPSGTQNKSGFYPSKKYAIDGISVRLAATFGAQSIFGKVAKRVWQFMVRYFYLIHSVNNGETIIVYHSVSLSLPVRMIKFFKKARLILQVEEIYGDVNNNPHYKRKEQKIFRVADGFIFPTNILNKEINMQGKPYVIVHGTYKVIQKSVEKYNDGKIHCVYSGTFETAKGGCIMAVKAAEYLDNGFCLHIIGFGDKQEIQRVQQTIEEIRKKTVCEIRYDGLKTGNEFIEYIQKCDIGLSTQNPDAEYNNTSFPSKVLTYLANGLHVVSIKIPVLEQSSVNGLLTYYDHNNPADVAGAIRKLSASNQSDNCRQKMIDLDNQFKTDIQNLLEVL